MDAQQLVDLSLGGPLRGQRRDGIVSSIQNQEYWRSVGLSKVEQLFFLCDLVSYLGGQFLRHQAILFVPYERVLLEREKQSYHTLRCPLQRIGVPYVWTVTP